MTKKYIKARKPHICSHCTDVIEKGEIYFYSDVVSGTIERYCNECRPPKKSKNPRKVKVKPKRKSKYEFISGN